MGIPHRRQENSFYSQGDWDVDAWVQIIAIEYERLVEGYPFNQVFRSFVNCDGLRVLDIGSGTGIFPTYLNGVLSDPTHLQCDLLDASQASLNESGRVLDNLGQFSVVQKLHALIEDIPEILANRTGIYDLAWAIHSLTTVDVGHMQAVFEHVLELLAPGGMFFIYQLSESSTYQRLHQFYRQHHAAGKDSPPYMEVEQSVSMLKRIEAHFHRLPFTFEHVVPQDQEDLLELYLRKCVLNHSIESIEFFDPLLPEYLDPKGGRYRFPQKVDLLVVQG